MQFHFHDLIFQPFFLGPIFPRYKFLDLLHFFPLNESFLTEYKRASKIMRLEQNL